MSRHVKYSVLMTSLCAYLSHLHVFILPKNRFNISSLSSSIVRPLKSTLDPVLDSARTVLTRQGARTPVRTSRHHPAVHAVPPFAPLGRGRTEGQLGAGLWRGSQPVVSWVSRDVMCGGTGRDQARQLVVLAVGLKVRLRGGNRVPVKVIEVGERENKWSQLSIKHQMSHSLALPYISHLPIF